MDLVVDGDKFDELQPWYVGEIIEAIKHNLEQAGIGGEKLKELCGDIAFSICAQIDSSAGFEVEGIEYASYLAFSGDDDTMFYPGGNSFLHEYVFGVLDEIFDGNA